MYHMFRQLYLWKSLSLLTALFGISSTVAAATPLASVTCLPSEELETSQEGGVGSFDIRAGKETLFSCTVANQTDGDIDLRLVGRQVFVGSKTAPTVSVADVMLTAKAKEDLSLVFPAVYQSGTYHYLLSLVDLNQQPVSPEMLFFGKLGGTSQPTIESMVADKQAYHWGDKAELSVDLKVPKDEAFPKGYTLRVEFLATNETVCSVAVERYPVEVTSSKVAFTLPQASQSCTNTVSVTLQDQSGKTVDSQRIAFGLPAVDESDAPIGGFLSMAHPLVWGGIAVFLLILLSLWFILRRR